MLNNMTDPQNQNPSKEEVQEAYQEFEVGIQKIRQDLHDLVEQSIKKVDQKQVEKILNDLKNL